MHIEGHKFSFPTNFKPEISINWNHQTKSESKIYIDDVFLNGTDVDEQQQKIFILEK